ncbi:hypothetical protein [Faecalicatena contorta]|uniref:hypothetical protein n=1 Tax=Faecalicatena contorta TaxID=39482 RepID=UPI001F40C48A|nr:hypothetical protein [Faecalicatena contorta]MCF2553955.1 hypothetical protein [Faecalicatena contorta]
MRKRKKRIPKKSILLLSAAVLLLLGSTIGSTRAALTYYSENYVAGMELSSIGVSLLENGKVVSSRDYADNGEWKGEADGVLLDGFLEEGEKIIPGKNYDEVLSVRNSGNIDTYVRVIVTTNWLDKEKKKVPVTTLDPGLIELHYLDGWRVDDAASTSERTVLYYQDILSAGSEVAFADSLRINPDICNRLTQTVDDNVYTYTYEYDGYSFQIAAEVDAVQTHNGKDAVKSAWGIDGSILGL